MIYINNINRPAGNNKKLEDYCHKNVRLVATEVDSIKKIIIFYDIYLYGRRAVT